MWFIAEWHHIVWGSFYDSDAVLNVVEIDEVVNKREQDEGMT